MTIKQCTGDCCREFPISGMTSTELTKAAERGYPEILAIAAMVVPLNKTKCGAPLFTCRHWNTETKRCLIYNSRPLMCSDYPYRGGACETCGGRYNSSDPTARPEVKEPACTGADLPDPHVRRKAISAGMNRGSGRKERGKR